MATGPGMCRSVPPKTGHESSGYWKPIKQTVFASLGKLQPSARQQIHHGLQRRNHPDQPDQSQHSSETQHPQPRPRKSDFGQIPQGWCTSKANYLLFLANHKSHRTSPMFIGKVRSQTHTGKAQQTLLNTTFGDKHLGEFINDTGQHHNGIKEIPGPLILSGETHSKTLRPNSFYLLFSDEEVTWIGCQASPTTKLLR